MKKITLLFAFIGMITLQSCTVNEVQNTQDNDTISQVFEVTRSFNSANGFTANVTFPYTIYSSDMVLVYRLSGVYQGADVWKLLPETYYFNDGTLDFRYDFDFTKYDAQIYMDGYDLPGVSAAYRTNQVFRIVIIPAGFLNKNSFSDYSNYNKTLEAFHIKADNIIKVN